MKKEKSPEEIAENERRKKNRAAVKSLALKVNKLCGEIGLRPLELQLDYLKNNNTKLPNDKISKELNIMAYQAGIDIFKGIEVKFKDLL